MKICVNCILPETFPGVNFDDDGLCAYCRSFSGKEEGLRKGKGKYAEKFMAIIEKHRNEEGGGRYDLLMAYSGGKDSTYTLLLLKKKYNLHILAFSLDNGFVSKVARKNIDTVVDSLGIDHIMFKPRWDMLRKIFSRAAEEDMFSKKSLERASTICTSCISLVKAACLNTAIEKKIPMIGFGWSPGQAPVQSSIMKNNASFVEMAQRAVREPMRSVVGDAIDDYFISPESIGKDTAFPYNVHPLAWEHYNEKEILEELKKHGWQEPDDTDSNSSNCLLNAYANEIHIRKHGFHPYVWEVANMIRQNVMGRDEGYQKIYNKQSSTLLRAAREKLASGEPEEN